MSLPVSSVVNEELDRILSSKVFKQSQVLSNFLRYIVVETLEDKPNEIKEYSIAVKALGKPPDFNPQLDAVIRIHAGRLRRALHEYYSQEGANDPVIISLEKGTYVPQFITGDIKRNNGTSKARDTHTSYDTISVNTVAVLPFKNLSGDKNFDFLVDGFCEQLSSDLALFQEISVIAYYSTSRFSDEKQDIRNVGKELSASHLITGSIFRDKKYLRVSIQLVSAENGKQLWTQTYERSVNSTYPHEIFDDIIKQVVSRLGGYYGFINRSTASSTQIDPLMDQNTIDAVFWYYHYQLRYTEDIFQIARKRLENAVQANPNYALAWAVLGQLYVDGCAHGYSTVNDPLQESQKCVHKALQIDPNCQQAYLSLAWLHIFAKNKSAALAALENCFSINPRSPFFLGGLSFLMGCVGEYEKSLEFFGQSTVLNPYYSWWVNLGPFLSYFYKGDYEKALDFAFKINMPGIFWDPIFKIATLGQLDRKEEAAAIAEKFQLQYPGAIKVVCPTLKAVLFHELLYDRIIEGLRKGGLELERKMQQILL